jgi:acetyl esterase
MENIIPLKIDPNKITIAGDSAGGALATTVTRKFRSVVNAQLLIYPVTDNSLKTSSWNEFQNGPLLNLNGAIQAWNWYLPNVEDWDNPDAVPLLADDLTNLPPTFVAISEFDPLRDEGIIYNEKLRSNNTDVQQKIYTGTTHGFFQMGGFVDDTKLLINDLAEFVKKQNSLK